MHSCFVSTTNADLGQAVGDAFCNVLPLSLLAVVVRAVLKAEIMRRSTAVQALTHAGLAMGFSFTWYATLILLLAVSGDLRGGVFRIIGFTGPALTWQVFQGLLIYVATAATCYAVRGGPRGRDGHHRRGTRRPAGAHPLPDPAGRRTYTGRCRRYRQYLGARRTMRRW